MCWSSWGGHPQVSMHCWQRWSHVELHFIMPASLWIEIYHCINCGAERKIVIRTVKCWCLVSSQQVPFYGIISVIPILSWMWTIVSRVLKTKVIARELHTHSHHASSVPKPPDIIWSCCHIVDCTAAKLFFSRSVIPLNGLPWALTDELLTDDLQQLGIATFSVTCNFSALRLSFTAGALTYKLVPPNLSPSSWLPLVYINVKVKVPIVPYSRRA